MHTGSSQNINKSAILFNMKLFAQLYVTIWNNIKQNILGLAGVFM